jgi:hypothetical protein
MNTNPRNLLGKDGDSFPILEDAPEMFTAKGIRTVFMTIGNSKTAHADLEIAESLGCPIHAVPLSATQAEEWGEVISIIKERNRENAVYPFSTGSEGKWILPKNVRVHKSIPWWTKGQIDISNNSLQTLEAMDMLVNICANMKLKDDSVRLDILKVDTVSTIPGFERGLLGAILDAGFRPSLILVNWSKRPDVDICTTMAAGHLQNTGYRLMSKVDNKFLYYFTDHDMYQICSWEDTKCFNPMMNEIISNTLASKEKEGTK